MERHFQGLEKGLGPAQEFEVEGSHVSMRRQKYGDEGTSSRFISSSKVREVTSAGNQRIFGNILFGLCCWALVYFYIDMHTPLRFGQQVCNWIGFSGIDLNRWDDFSNVNTRPEDLSNDSRVLRQIPQYVLDYAPLVHLYSEEEFWPCDIAEHLFHVTPELNYTPIQSQLVYSNLTNLDKLNQYEKGRHVYLTSKDNVEERPEWLGGQKNIPDDFNEEELKDFMKKSHPRSSSSRLRKRSNGGRSDAPAVLITIDKGHGIVDAFWFYFYSYNLGNVVFNIRWGNHVGDWEHSLVRFQHGKPKLVFVSEHYFGAAYTYGAVEKIGKRPVVYSATGTHAMYATSGSHPYVLPLGILQDETDRGPLWDPVLNSHTYTYNHLTDTLRASNVTPHAPTQWFYFSGHWGDRYYPLNDDRQYGLLGEYHYVSGPLGPRFKNLGRRKVCQGGNSDPCDIKNWLDVDEVRVYPGEGEGEDWPDDPEMRPPGLDDIEE